MATGGSLTSRGALSLAALVVGLAACRVETDEPVGLRVVTDLRPSVVSAGEFPRGLDLTLMATNRGGRALSVPQRRPMKHPGSAASPDTAHVGFGLRVLRADGTAIDERWVASPDSVVSLHGGQTVRTRMHLDFGARGAHSIPPGEYSVVGSFGDVESPVVRLRVLP